MVVIVICRRSAVFGVKRTFKLVTQNLDTSGLQLSAKGRILLFPTKLGHQTLMTNQKLRAIFMLCSSMAEELGILEGKGAFLC